MIYLFYSHDYYYYYYMAYLIKPTIIAYDFIFIYLHFCFYYSFLVGLSLIHANTKKYQFYCRFIQYSYQLISHQFAKQKKITHIIYIPIKQYLQTNYNNTIIIFYCQYFPIILYILPDKLYSMFFSFFHIFLDFLSFFLSFLLIFLVVKQQYNNINECLTIQSSSCFYP